MQTKEIKQRLKQIETKYYVIGAVVLLLAVFGVYGLMNTSGENPQETSVHWQEFELQDVSTGDTYTISELEKPVLVETFAVWCSTCTNQQNEVKKYHEESGIKSVALNVDPNEDEQKVKQHIQRYGFNWKYSIAPTNMTKQLIREYGNSIAVPPKAPMVLVCENSTRRLPDDVKPASMLEQEIEKGC